MTKFALFLFALIISQYNCEKFSVIIENEDVDTIKRLYKDGSIEIKNYKEMNNKKFIENIETDLTLRQLKKLLKTSKILKNSIVKNKNNVHMWHLDRINQRNTKLDSHWADIYNGINGKNTNVYILESNIEKHENFKVDEYYRCDSEECVLSDNFVVSHKEDSHGNNVIGLVNGEYTGVATQTTLKVVDHMDFEFIGESLYFTSKDAADSKKPSIINMSFGCEDPTNVEECTELNSYISEILDSNIKPEDKVLVVTAAGNEGVNACPASLYNDNHKMRNNYILVGSTNIFDEKSEFTNWGNCIDIYAPGTGVITTDRENKYVFTSGTSFSSPLVSGIVASLWSSYPLLSAQQIKSILLNNATPDKIKKHPNDNENTIVGTNLLVYYKNDITIVEHPDTDHIEIENSNGNDRLNGDGSLFPKTEKIMEYVLIGIIVLALLSILVCISQLLLKIFK